MKGFCSYILLLMVALCVGCSSGEQFDSSLFTRKLYSPQYASGFEIRATEDGTATLIACHNPWQGAKDVTQYLLIDPEGRFNSSQSHNLQRIDGPARRIVCMSSSYVAMLSAIGKSEYTVGVSGIDFISDEYVNSNQAREASLGFPSLCT